MFRMEPRDDAGQIVHEGLNSESRNERLEHHREIAPGHLEKVSAREDSEKVRHALKLDQIEYERILVNWEVEDRLVRREEFLRSRCEDQVFFREEMAAR